MQKKGQVSIEYLIITGFLLLVVGIMSSVSIMLFSENASIAKSQLLVSAIVKNSNLAASLGDGSALFFESEVPQGASSLEILNHTVNLRIATASGESDVFNYADVPLTPSSLDASPGRRKFKAEYNDGNVTVSQVE